MKVKDLLKMNIDIDVVDDYCEDLWIAFCGAYELTEDGIEHFAQALEYPVELNSRVAIVCVDDPEEKVARKQLRKAKELFYSLAGYCSEEDYNKWFIEVDD